MNEKSITIQKFEMAPVSFETEASAIEALKEKWVTVPDAEDKHGYELVRVGISELVNLRGNIDKRRKEVKREVNAYKKDVDISADSMIEQIKEVETRLRDAKGAVDERKKREKEEKQRIEQERIAALRQKLHGITEAGNVAYGTTVEEIESRIASLRAMEIQKDEYQEVYAEADIARNSSLARLDAVLAAERQRIEDERLRAEEAARVAEEQRIERERLEADKAEQERARRENEEKLRIEREKFETEKREREEAEKAEREAREKKEADERAEREREQLEQREADEKRRAEAQAKIDEENAKAEEKRAAEQARIDAESKRLADERAAIEAEKAEQRRIEEEKERHRIEKQKRKENEQVKELNRAQALDALNDMDTDGELLPEAILDAIIAGKIPHVEYVG